MAGAGRWVMTKAAGTSPSRHWARAARCWSDSAKERIRPATTSPARP